MHRRLNHHGHTTRHVREKRRRSGKTTVRTTMSTPFNKMRGRGKGRR